jgi:hypothetical protein
MKDRKTYKILTACNLICPIGINRLYLGTGSFGRIISLDYLYIGAIADLFYMDKAFDEAMAKRGFTNTDIRNAQGK